MVLARLLQMTAAKHSSPYSVAQVLSIISNNNNNLFPLLLFKIIDTIHLLTIQDQFMLDKYLSTLIIVLVSIILPTIPIILHYIHTNLIDLKVSLHLQTPFMLQVLPIIYNQAL